MKRLFYMMLICIPVIVLWGCTENGTEDEPTPPISYLEFSEETDISPEFEADGGTSLVEFTSSHDWTASANQSWITLSRKSGTPQKTYFNITVSKNSSTSKRTGTITITADNKSYKINVSQQGAEKVVFEFSSDTDTAPEFEAEGGTSKVSFTTSHDWTASASQSWISLSRKSGTPSTANFTITVDENTTTSERTGVVTITSNGKSYKVNVSQSGKNEDIFKLSPTTGTISSEGGEIILTLKHDVDVDYIKFGIFDENGDEVDWIELIDTRTNSLDLVFSVAKNTTTHERVGIIVLYDSKNDKEQSSIITQNGTESTFKFTNDTDTSPEFEAKGGTSKVSFTTSHDWTASVDKSWITLSRKSGTPSTASFTITVSKNTTTSPRTGVVTIVSNNQSYKINVSQEAQQNSGEIEESEDRKIYYYTVTNSVIDVSNAAAFNSNIKSNSYQNGVGVIVFDNTLTTVGDRAFYNNQLLTKVILSATVKTIGASAFEGCTSLNGTCPIPTNIETIGDRAFYGCVQLTTVNIGNDCTSIGSEAFYNIANLTSLTIGSKVKTIGSKAFFYCQKLSSVYIPNSVTTIGSSVFENCIALSSVTLGNGLISLGAAAFKSCSAITNLMLPSGITAIEESLFEFCDALTNVTLPSQLKTIGKNAFSYCDNLNEIIIPNTAYSIGENAFVYSKIKNLYIPKSITTIAARAFDMAIIDKLTIDINIPDYDNYLDSPFLGSRHNEIIIGENVSSIGSNAFSSGSIITIGSNVTKIGANAFETIISTMYCKPSNPPSVTTPFSINPNGKIYVPRNSVSAYKAAQYWSNYASYIVGYDF